MKKQDLYRQTIQRWGKEGQIDMFHEEVGELLSALNKYKRGRVPAKDVITEIADVQIMAEQLAEMFGSVAVYNEKLRKLDRLARRVQKAALQEVGIEVTDEGEPMERFKNRMSCKHCGMEESKDKNPKPEPTCKSCGFYENNCPYIRGKFIPYPKKVCKDYTYSVMTEVDLEKFTDKIKTFQGRYKHPEIVSIKGAMAFMARMLYQYPNVARQWYEQLPKVTMD